MNHRPSIARQPGAAPYVERHAPKIRHTITAATCDNCRYLGHGCSGNGYGWCANHRHESHVMQLREGAAVVALRAVGTKEERT